jgi:hypothetical protein
MPNHIIFGCPFKNRRIWIDSRDATALFAWPCALWLLLIRLFQVAIGRQDILWWEQPENGGGTNFEGNSNNAAVFRHGRLSSPTQSIYWIGWGLRIRKSIIGIRSVQYWWKSQVVHGLLDHHIPQTRPSCFVRHHSFSLLGDVERIMM